MFLNLRAVIYDVDDMQKAKDWYGKVLNLEPETDETPFTGFSIGSDRLVLNLTDNSQQEKCPGAIAYWAVSDVRGEYQRLVDHGAVEQGGIRDIGGGLLLATVKDPFGNIIGIAGMGGAVDNKAIEEKPSKTALWTTHMRAFSTREANEEIRGKDHLAELFLEDEDRNALQDIESRQQQKDKYFVVGVYEYVMARTRAFDHFFKQAIEKGVEQVVFLGAGYDSRPYRFRELLDTIDVYELDVAPTQQHKSRCLEKAEIEIPARLTYVPINFNSESIQDALNAAGYDKEKKTLFMWEGVTYYLAPEAVGATFEFIKQNSPSGSIVAFDYIALWPGIFDAYGVKELMNFNAKNQSGESGNKFALEEGAVESFLSEKGFKMSSHLNSGEIENGYLSLKDGTIFGHVTGGFRIVQALTM
ncbi:MAG: SAM-dependent methyltransferase [Desulfobacterales bacterium]|nr:SAM-dependent methyltransferase [Desulfobacterales bacterium]